MRRSGCANQQTGQESANATQCAYIAPQFGLLAKVADSRFDISQARAQPVTYFPDFVQASLKALRAGSRSLALWRTSSASAFNTT